jgi:hypothetical protein
MAAKECKERIMIFEPWGAERRISRTGAKGKDPELFLKRPNELVDFGLFLSGI